MRCRFNCWLFQFSAPPLATRRAGGGSPIPVATALWNHGPLMLEKMKERAVPWPRFRTGEIADLLEYLSATTNP